MKLGDTSDNDIWSLRSEDLGAMYGRQSILLVLIPPRIGRCGKHKCNVLPASIVLPLALSGRSHNKIWQIESLRCIVYAKFIAIE